MYQLMGLRADPGFPFINRLMSGLLEPTKIKTPGCDIAGRIESVGKKVKRFEVGDEVYGDLSSCGWCVLPSMWLQQKKHWH